MTPAEVLEHLVTEGVGVVLSVRLEANIKPSDETVRLIREHRDDLLTLLAHRHLSGKDYYLKIATSSDKAYIMAKPHHLDEAVRLDPWGVLSDSKGRLITSWGDVPGNALEGMKKFVPDIHEEKAA